MIRNSTQLNICGIEIFVSDKFTSFFVHFLSFQNFIWNIYFLFVTIYTELNLFDIFSSQSHKFNLPGLLLTRPLNTLKAFCIKDFLRAYTRKDSSLRNHGKDILLSKNTSAFLKYSETLSTVKAFSDISYGTLRFHSLLEAASHANAIR